MLVFLTLSCSSQSTFYSEEKSDSCSDCRVGGSTCSLAMLEQRIINNLGEQSSAAQDGLPWLRAAHTKKQTNCWFLRCLIKYVSTASATSNWKCGLQTRGPLSSLSVDELQEGFYLLWSQKACKWMDKDVGVVQSSHQGCQHTKCPRKQRLKQSLVATLFLGAGSGINLNKSWPRTWTVCSLSLWSQSQRPPPSEWHWAS